MYAQLSSALLFGILMFWITDPDLAPWVRPDAGEPARKKKAARSRSRNTARSLLPRS